MDLRELDSTQAEVKPKNYPKFIQAKIDHINQQLARNSNWFGINEVEVVFAGNHTYALTLSHLGMRKLRGQGFTVRCVGGFTLRNVDNAMAEIAKPKVKL